jgi:hypothetical protein
MPPETIAGMAAANVSEEEELHQVVAALRARLSAALKKFAP